jgi:hypothetical protein
MIKGMPVCLEHNSSAARLEFTVTNDEGNTATPDAAPDITIYSTSGTQLVAATTMTVVTPVNEGYITYNQNTTAFNIGDILTGGTSDATGRIVSDEKSGVYTVGVLYVTNIDGAYVSAETITDTGSGTAVVQPTTSLFSRTYYYDLDTTSTGTYDVARNYSAKIEYDISSRAFVRRIYFDIAYYPMVYPLVTSNDINERHPSWTRLLPKSWKDWTPAIKMGHAELVRTIHAHGEQAAHYVKRDHEMWNLGLAFACAEIAKASTGMSTEDRDFWLKEAQGEWTRRGLYVYDTDDDVEIDTDGKVISSGFTR